MWIISLQFQFDKHFYLLMSKSVDELEARFCVEYMRGGGAESYLSDVCYRDTSIILHCHENDACSVTPPSDDPSEIRFTGMQAPLY